MSVRLLTGDCRQIMEGEGPFDMILADPPYGDTSLVWDRWPEGWLQIAAASLKPTGSLWCFGSMRMFLTHGAEFRAAGLRYAQDIVWEKHNGSGFAADRFKRVHEHAVQFYRVGAPWGQVFNSPQRVAYHGPDKTVRAPANRAKHAGSIKPQTYVDDGTRLVRTVIKMTQPRDGKHETQKPVELLEILIRTSCPPDGLVGDFFAGSGAGGSAAQMVGRRYVGCEAKPDIAERARDRLSGSLSFGSAAEALLA